MIAIVSKIIFSSNGEVIFLESALKEKLYNNKTGKEKNIPTKKKRKNISRSSKTYLMSKNIVSYK